MHAEALTRRLTSKDALIGILGLGYVGLPLMLRYAEVGYRVLGFDIDPAKVDKLNAGETYIEHIPADAIRTAQSKGFSATTDFARARDCDALILCVPTPLNKYREPDLSFVIATTESIVPHLRAGQIVSLESTTWPGTTNVDDRRESPAIELMELLQHKGALISYSDPHVPRFIPMRRHDFDLESVPLTPETLATADCVLLATDHDRLDYDLIKVHARLIVDTRGRYQEPAEHIVRA